MTNGHSSGESGYDGEDAPRRQWLFDQLRDSSEGSHDFPPAPLVDALCDLGLEDSFDLGWGLRTYDPRADLTQWSGVVANSKVMIEFTATAKLAGVWNGNRRGNTSYEGEPKVELKLIRLADVTSIEVTKIGAKDAVDWEHRVRESWNFSFADGTTRLHKTDAHDKNQPSDLPTLLRRLAHHL
jgi:hypothetical protein